MVTIINNDLTSEKIIGMASQISKESRDSAKFEQG